MGAKATPQAMGKNKAFSYGGMSIAKNLQEE